MKESLRSVISLLYLGHYVYSNSQVEAGIGEARISPLYFESVQYNTSKVPDLAVGSLQPHSYLFGERKYMFKYAMALLSVHVE